jgi:hypothetical protein
VRISAAYEEARTELGAVSAEWATRKSVFDVELAAGLANRGDSGGGLTALKSRLTNLQRRKAELEAEAARLADVAQPALEKLMAVRAEMLDELAFARAERRRRRRDRIKALNRLMAGTVKIELESEAGDSEYRQRIIALAKGSHLRADVLEQLISKSSPIKLVESYFNCDAEAVGRAIGGRFKVH